MSHFINYLSLITEWVLPHREGQWNKTTVDWTYPGYNKGLKTWKRLVLMHSFTLSKGKQPAGSIFTGLHVQKAYTSLGKYTSCPNAWAWAYAWANNKRIWLGWPKLHLHHMTKLPICPIELHRVKINQISFWRNRKILLVDFYPIGQMSSFVTWWRRCNLGYPRIWCTHLGRKYLN